MALGSKKVSHIILLLTIFTSVLFIPQHMNHSISHSPHLFHHILAHRSGIHGGPVDVFPPAQVLRTQAGLWVTCTRLSQIALEGCGS